MSRLGFVLVTALAIGCVKPRAPGPPPQDSEADLPRSPIISGPQKTPGTGHPDRLPADMCRAVRGNVEVWIDSVTVGERLQIHLTIRNRSKDQPLAFANWDKSEQVSLKDDGGKSYPLLPLTAEQERTIREWEAEHPDPTYAFGRGPVTHDRVRVTNLTFPPAAISQSLDLDLDGAPVGFADPILFHIPAHMVTAEMFGRP